MNEDYLLELYSFLGQQDETFSQDVEFEQFVIDMGNLDYASNIRGYLIEQDPSFEDDVSLDNFLLDIKKKDGSEVVNSVSEAGPLDLQPSSVTEEELTEEDYFTGGFGDALRAFDSVSPIGIGDFIDDMARAVAGGHNQGIAAENASDLLLRGSLSTEEDIQSYLDANKNATKYGASKEMQEYQKTYEENGKGFMGVVLGLAKSGVTILPELIVSSLTSMASNSDSILAGGTVLATGAAYGAGAGVFAGGVGAAPGAVAGAAAALPYAFAAAGSALEMGATFSELLQEEAGDKELTASLIQEILNDEEKYTSIRNKAVARGVIIGAIDAFTGKLGGKLGGKILTKGGMQTAKEATKKQVLKSVAGAGAVEGVGGSVGEATARLAIGQEMDISEIALEGLAEIPGGVKDLISARFSKPKYKVNGERVTAEVIDDLIETMTLKEIVASKITIDNDYDGRAKKMQDKIVKLSLEKELLDANPNLNKATLDEMTNLQLELDKVDGNKTEIAKEKASSIRQKIKDLQETPLEDTGVVDETIESKTELKGEEETKNKKAKLKDNVIITDQGQELDIIIFDGENGKVDSFKDRKRQDRFSISAKDKDGKTIGAATFWEKDDGTWFANIVDVDKDYRRGGIATAMYDFAETQGLEIVDSNKQTESGKKFKKDRFTTKREKQPQTIQVPGRSKIDVEIDADGKAVAVDRKTRKPVKKVPIKVQKFILEQVVDVNDGTRLDINEQDNPTPQQYTSEVSDNSTNVKEIAETIDIESRRLKNQTKEEKREAADPLDIKSIIGQITEEDFIKWGDRNNITTQIRKYWFRKKEKSITGKLFKDSNKKDGLDAAVMSLDGYTEENSKEMIQTVIDFILDHPTGKLDIQSGKSTELINLEVKFEELTGLKAIPTNIKTVLGIDPNREPISSLKDKSKDQYQKEASEPGVFSKKKKGPSAKRILGQLNTDKKFTLTDKQLVIKTIKDLNRGAKTAVKSFKIASKILSKEFTDAVKKGTLTVKQSAALLRKFSKVNMLNDSSIENFVEYMSRVIDNADYLTDISRARKLVTKAKKNIGKKIGIADAISSQLQTIFSINPTLIPESIFKNYLSLLEMFGDSGAVLNPSSITEVNKTTQDILRVMDEQFSMVEELTQRYDAYNNKVEVDGKVSFAGTIKRMLDDGLISEADGSLMMKHKSDIVPAVEKKVKTEEELQEEKDLVIENILENTALKTSKLPSEDEIDLADNFKKLIKDKEVLSHLSIQDLKHIEKLIVNINNGYLPHLSQIMTEKMNAIIDGKNLSDAIKKAKIFPVSKMYAKIKNLLSRNKRGSTTEAIRRNPLYYIDQVFSNFKGKPIFNAIFNPSAVAQERYSVELKNIFGKIEKAETAVAKSFKMNGNSTLISKFKQMIYMIQLEHDSNIGNSEVNQAAGFIKNTIDKIDSGETTFSMKDSVMLQEIYDEFKDENGEIDNIKLKESFNEAELASIKTIQEVNASLGEKAVFTSAIIRGDRMNPRDNYVHLNVLADSKSEAMAAPTTISDFNKSLKPSTRSKSLIKRTGGTSALNFDVYASASRGAKSVLLDYHLTEPIRTARRTLIQAEANLKGDKTRVNTEEREVLTAIKASFDEVVENLLMNSYTETSLGDSAFNWVQKNGYRAILASSTRWVAELSSNGAFALITNPKAFISGSKMGIKFLNSDSAVESMKVLGSKQTTRIYPNDDMSGRMVDSRLLTQSQATKGGRAKGKVENKAGQIWSYSGEKWMGGVATIADGLISTPDKIVMRPMWFGKFSTEFKQLTGQDPDFDKISSKDKDYMSKFESELSQATTIADETSVMTGSTSNPFMGILKGTSNPNQGVALKAFNAFNNFMTTFLIYEYITARTGIVNAIGRGSLTKTKGAQLIAGSATRMVMYTMMAQVLGEALGGVVEEEEEETKSWDKKLGQAMASSFSSMLMGRDFGNATKILVNWGVEEFNKEYLDMLRDGDYDVYKDGIQYQIVPKGKNGKGATIGDWAINMSASLGPAVKTIDLILRKATEGDKKTEEAQQRREDEINIRIPLEVLGNTGFIPLYKDVRRLVLSSMYDGMGKAAQENKEKKQRKLDLLQGYANETEMKRYDPTLWSDTFGPNSPDWDSKQQMLEEKRNLRKEKQRLKDLENGYYPTGNKKGLFSDSNKKGLFGKGNKKGLFN